jgi:DNA-binding NtrC family response regulator
MALTILFVEDVENARKNWSQMLANKGYEVIQAGTLAEARTVLAADQADVVLLDVELPDGYGPVLLDEMAMNPVRPPVIIITGYGNIEMAVDAMKKGAHDFMEKPIDMERLDKSIKRAAEIVAMRRELAHYREAQTSKAEFIVGNSAAMQTLVSQAQKAASVGMSVLITGETGTGKELLASYIHKAGPRQYKQMVAINSAAIQPTMIEEELFGHEPGVFTGATKRKHGLIEIAEEGVLFLDEISTMPIDVQAKFLRVLEEKAFRRIGGTSLITTNIQVVAASNRDLRTMIAAGTFREDLYYRLKKVDLHMPALRERKEDIPELVGYFVRDENSQQGANVQQITQRALDALMRYDWPGNIRELRNTIGQAVLFCDGEKIDIADLPVEIVKAE